MPGPQGSPAYLFGLITGPAVSLTRAQRAADRFRVLARGWFSAGLPEQALNHRPALPVGRGSAYSSRSGRYGYGGYYMPVHLPVKDDGGQPWAIKQHEAPQLGLLLVGGIGLEPTTSAMSKQCSNQLSYPPQAGAYYKRGISEMAIECRL